MAPNFVKVDIFVFCGKRTMGLEQFDIYPKLAEEFKVRTYSGALISIVASGLMFLLFMNEFSFYLSTQVKDHLVVDLSTEGRLSIDFEIQFHRLPCVLLTLDVMDVAGEQSIDVDHDIIKRPIDHRGQLIGGQLKQGLGGKLN